MKWPDLRIAEKENRCLQLENWLLAKFAGTEMLIFTVREVNWISKS